MLKRLAAAGILTAAAGGVLMTATPAMAGGGDYDRDIYSNHHLNFENDCEIAVDSFNRHERARHHRGLWDIWSLFGDRGEGRFGRHHIGDFEFEGCKQSNAVINKN